MAHIDLESLAREAAAISAKDYARIDDHDDERYYNAEYKEGYDAGYEAAKQMMYTPSKWKSIGNWQYECQRCKHVIDCVGFPIKTHQNNGNHLFCDHCGAKMN